MKNAKPAKRPQPPRIRTVHAEPVQNAIATQPSRLTFKPEVLDRVGVSYPSLWKWMRAGKFPASREVGGKVAWLENEIDEWIASRPVRRLKNAEA